MRAESQKAAAALSGVIVPVPVRLRLPRGFGGVRIRQVSCGAAHTAIVTEYGNLFVCGAGSGGRLGLGDGVLPSVVPHPVLVESLARARVRIVEAACGLETTLARAELRYSALIGGGPVAEAAVNDGESNPSSEADTPRTTGPRADGNLSARSIRPPAADSQMACARRLDARGLFGEVEGGEVYACGVRWALGDSSAQYFKQVHGIPPARRVSAGASHQAVVTAAGELWTWGDNDKGSAGHPLAKRFLPKPARVQSLYKAPRNLALGQPCRQSSTFA